MSLVVVAGGHGKIARQLLALLVERGHEARGLIRNPDHVRDLELIGAEPVVCDLEGEADLAAALAGADAAVFAAGAGPGSGPERKLTVDLGGAVKLIEACRTMDVRRYLMVSSIGADDPEGGVPEMRPYLGAKAQADAALAASGLRYTICRPGPLTDDDGTGMVAIGERLERHSIPRADVAAVLLGCLDRDNTVGKTFVLTSGPTPIDQALASL